MIFLTNSSEGRSWSTMFELRRPFRNRWFAQGSYIYGVSKSIMDGTSSQAASNWGNVLHPGRSEQPAAGDLGVRPGPPHQLLGSYEIPIVWGITTTVSAYYSGQSGRPFTLLVRFERRQRRRPHVGNDLLYIPASASEVTFTNGTYQDLLNFVNDDECLAKYIGKIIPRNACRAPWQNQLDMRFNFGLPFQRIKAEITLDILNFINLLDSESGLQRYATFNQHPAGHPGAHRRPGDGLQHRVHHHADVHRSSTATTSARAGSSSSADASGSRTASATAKAAAGTPAAAFFV